MPTALRGHAVNHAHAKPWAWHTWRPNCTTTTRSVRETGSRVATWTPAVAHDVNRIAEQHDIGPIDLLLAVGDGGQPTDRIEILIEIARSMKGPKLRAVR